MSQLLANLFGVEPWFISFIFDIVVVLGMIGVITGLTIELRAGKNGISLGMLHVILAFFHQQIYTVFAIWQMAAGTPDGITSLGNWRLATFIHLLGAFIYATVKIFSYAKSRKNDNP